MNGRILLEARPKTDDEPKDAAAKGGEEPRRKSIKDIPQVELYSKDFYDLSGEREDVPGAFPAFRDWVETRQREIIFTQDFKAWPLRERINKEKSWKWGDTDVAAAMYDAPQVKEELESQELAGMLDETLSRLKETGVRQHLPRLLTHRNAPACARFALSCIRYIRKLDEEDISDCRSIPESLDGNNARQFFTLAPYIHEGLISRGMGEEEAFDLVLKWSRSREERNDRSDARYPGTGVTDTHFDIRLAYNGSHRTHQLAKKIGDHIAAALIEIHSR